MKHDVFLSYNRKDAQAAEKVAKFLREHRVRVWKDLEQPDRNTWTEDIADAINQSRAFVCLFGEHGAGKTQKKELGFANQLKDEGKLIVELIQLPNSTTDTYLKFIRANQTMKDWTDGVTDENLVALLWSINGFVTEDIPFTKGAAATQLVISIAGGSGSGLEFLTTLTARELERNGHKHSTIGVVSADDYYKSGQIPPGQRNTNRYNIDVNLDHPEMLNLELLGTHINKLRQGYPVLKPVWDKKSNTLIKSEFMNPPDVLLVEGTFLLSSQAIVEASDANVFVKVDDDIRLARRISKDVWMRQMELRNVMEYYFANVRPGYNEWVRPMSRKHANVSVEMSLNSSNHDELDFAGTARRLVTKVNKHIKRG